MFLPLMQYNNQTGTFQILFCITKCAEGMGCAVHGNDVHIHKCFALSPQLFSKATEMISMVFKSASSVNNVEIL